MPVYTTSVLKKPALEKGTFFVYASDLTAAGVVFGYTAEEARYYVGVAATGGPVAEQLSYRAGLVHRLGDDLRTVTPIEAVGEPYPPLTFTTAYEGTDPAYGCIQVNRFNTTSADLVGHPSEVSGGISLSIGIARASGLRGNGCADQWMQTQELVRIEMSETQWASALSNLGRMPVPCTLTRYRHPSTGDLVTPRYQVDREHLGVQFNREIQAQAVQALATLDGLQKRIAEALNAKPVRKKDVEALQEEVASVRRALGDSVPFLVERAVERVDDYVRIQEGEFAAHIDNRLRALGEQALASHFTEFGSLPVLTNADVRRIAGE